MTIEPLTIADTCIIIIIAISLIVGLMRGFIRELISLVVWVVAILLGLKYGKVLGNYLLSSMIGEEEIRFIVMFLILFIAVMIVGMIISAALRTLVAKTGLSFFDRLFGVIFGFARGALVVCMVIMFINLSSWQDKDWYKQSYFVEKLQPFVGWLEKNVPDRMSQVSAWVGDQSKHSV